MQNIKPYVIPKLAEDIKIRLHNQLDSSADRIFRTRPAEEAQMIIQEIRNEEHVYPFRWNLSIYRNPPKKPNKVQYSLYTNAPMFVINSKVALSLCNFEKVERIHARGSCYD